ncbi:hypothetical protein AYO38_08310 [bacterium SCGC AG-212-C10]|nr:hypothetical protein AYO38_08310 [bacterium SCGC AG-212-C10]
MATSRAIQPPAVQQGVLATQADVRARTAATGRIEEFEVMRGVAIIFVVYLHAYFSWWDVTPHRHVFAMHVVHLFAHTAVPVFFFVSGFLLARDRSPSYSAFFRRKVSRIVVPIVFWMTAAFLYRGWQEPAGFDSALVKDLLLFNVTGQDYYLAVLLIFYVTFVFLKERSERTLAAVTIASFAINFVAIAWYSTREIEGDFAILAYRNPFIWVFPFAFGFWVAKRERGIRIPWQAVALAAIAMLAAGVAYIAQGEDGKYPVSYFGVSVFLFSCGSLVVYPALIRLALLRRGVRPLAMPFKELDRYAFAIYLVHMPFFVGYVTERYVSNNAGVMNDWWKLMNTIFLVGFVTSLAAVMAVGYAWPWFAHTFLGIERARPVTRGSASAAGR